MIFEVDCCGIVSDENEPGQVIKNPPSPFPGPAFRDPDRPAEAPPVRMPVVDVGGNQMDVISRLLKDRILLLGQQVRQGSLVAAFFFVCPCLG